MRQNARHSGFSLVELLVAATLFTFIVMGVSQLFASAIDIQRRATGYQKIQENALFVLETIAREVRVSAVMSPSGCSSTLTINHPVNGDVIYTYSRPAGTGMITRESSASGTIGTPAVITSEDVDVTAFQFCVMGAGPDDQQARVTVPITLQAVSGRASARVSVSLETTVVSRDLVEELTN